MTASINPDDYSYPPKEAADAREPQGFVYDNPNPLPVEPESTYVPEREFVLMPLFRRIGEMLGIRRREEPEYIYEAAPEPPAFPGNPGYQNANLAPSHQSAPGAERASVQKAPEPAQEPEQEWARLQPEVVSEAAPAI